MSGQTGPHNYRFENSKDHTKIRVVCGPCAKTSRWFDRYAEDEAMKRWCNDHHGYARTRGALAV